MPLWRGAALTLPAASQTRSPEMTVSSTVRTAGPFPGDGVVTRLPFEFRIFEASDVVATQTTLGVATTMVLGSHYTVEVNSDQRSDPGGTVVLLTPLAVGSQVDLTTNLAATQGLRLTTAGGFYPEAIENALDKLTIILQQIGVLSTQVLRVPTTESVPQLGSAAARALKTILFDASGNPILVPPGTGTATDVLATLAASSGSSLLGFINSGTGAVARTVQAKLRGLPVSPKDFGCAGDGVTDDTVNLLKALNTGRMVDLGGDTYAVSGTVAPTAFGGLFNGTLKQLAPTTSNCKTLNLVGFSNFVIDALKIDRGGSAGYTVGTLGASADWAGLRLENCTKFAFGKIWITNGGRGTGIALFGCTDFDPGEVMVDEHYWQEVVPASPVVVDDVLQPWWINNCSGYHIRGWRAKNCTSGGPGDPTLNVAASQVRNYARCAFGGMSSGAWSVIGCVVENTGQGFDFTGSLGNSHGLVAFNIARNCGVVGFKFANSQHSVQVIGNLADTCDQYGFLVSGMTEVSNPLVQNILGGYNVARNTGGLAGKYNGSAFAFSVESQPAVDTSYPRSVVWESCWVVDNRTLTLASAPLAGATSATLAAVFTLSSGNYTVVFANGDIRTVTFTKGATTMTWTGGLAAGATTTVRAPTTNVAFRNNVGALSFSTVGYNEPHGIRCSGECRVSVPGLDRANYFVGMHMPTLVVQGNGAGSDTVNSGVYSTASGGGLTLDGTEHQDTSGIHAASNQDTIYIKEAGRYVISAQTAFSANSTGERAIRLEVNGGNVEIEARVAAHATGKTWVTGTWSRMLFPGDTLKVMPFQNSGGALTVNRGDSTLTVTRVGAT